MRKSEKDLQIINFIAASVLFIWLLWSITVDLARLDDCLWEPLAASGHRSRRSANCGNRSRQYRSPSLSHRRSTLALSTATAANESQPVYGVIRRRRALSALSLVVCPPILFYPSIVVVAAMATAVVLVLEAVVPRYPYVVVYWYSFVVH